MKAFIAVLAGVLVGTQVTTARADNDGPRFPSDASFTTLTVTPLAIEGLTGDATGNVYTTGRAAAGTPCPVWKVFSGATPPAAPIPVGSIDNSVGACNPSGITFDRDGNLYVADANRGGVIWKLTPENMNPTVPFVTGVPGTNGLAFDRDGNLWTGDGTTGQGRVWKITPAGVATEMFRIQPMRNGTALGGGVSVVATAAEPAQGVGRQARTFPHTANGGNPQDLVANGLAFDREGDLFVADTARGAIWKVEFDRHGNIKSRMGCDAAFTGNTLCLDNVFVAHPLLEGTDGIALDRAGNIWNSANERNAIVVVTRQGRVVEVFRNPPNAAGLRNSADDAAGNAHILELPTSPFLLGHKFCTANSDGNRRDNFPNSAGEVNSGGAAGTRGKISCMDQDLPIPGLPLPVH
ncbi:MAG: SMP-30/gluconolactonase/LRE family protein [Burkholderiales bacterium]